jgi:dihydroneopterin aldolase
MIIKIKNFRLSTILGIYDWEQDFDREVIINAEIHTNYDKARYSNSINDTIDYDNIIKQIKQLLASKKFQLIEKMAQEILDLIMKDVRIEKCTLEVDKVKVVDEVDSFSISLTQER